MWFLVCPEINGNLKSHPNIKLAVVHPSYTLMDTYTPSATEKGGYPKSCWKSSTVLRQLSFKCPFKTLVGNSTIPSNCGWSFLFFCYATRPHISAREHNTCQVSKCNIRGTPHRATNFFTSTSATVAAS